MKLSRYLLTLLYIFCFLAEEGRSYRTFRASSLQKSSFSKLWSSNNDKYRVTSNKGVHTVSFEVAGREMSFETGKIGRQASGAVVAKTGDTIVYSTVCCERDPTPVDFTPLRVDYFARYRFFLFKSI
jgi:hypothetical protein